LLLYSWRKALATLHVLHMRVMTVGMHPVGKWLLMLLWQMLLQEVGGPPRWGTQLSKL
jgi:hypothetical protein